MWKRVRSSLESISCPLLENLDDRPIKDDFSNLLGDLRLNLVEWLFSRYDSDFYAQHYDLRDQSEASRAASNRSR
jgi:hypothetical protein